MYRREHDLAPSARYVAVATALRAAIATGTYRPGSALPSERELMSTHGISRGTARAAMRVLIDEGLVSIRRGARPVVIGVPRQHEQTLDELLSFSAWARSLGRVPGGRTVSLTRRPSTPTDVDRLGGAVGDPAWDLVRVRLLDGHPLMVERSTYPHAIGLIVAQLDLDTGSINEGLHAAGIVYARARHTLDAVAATTDDAELLGIAPGSPILRVRRSGTALDGRSIEWGEDHYASDSVAFVVENTMRFAARRRAEAAGQSELQHSSTARQQS